VQNIPIIILAAGSSSRMGQSKQLLPIGGKTLLERAVETGLASETGNVIVVLGANEVLHKKLIERYPIEIISNNEWEKGMGTSIKIGVKFIDENFPHAPAFIISVCDQPHLSSAHLKHLADTYHKGKNPIIASVYKNTYGVPILFDQSFKEELCSIKEGDGAKHIVLANREKVYPMPFPSGEIDLDTMEDYNTFIQ